MLAAERRYRARDVDRSEAVTVEYALRDGELVASERSAHHLCISATPSSPAPGFYHSQGARPAHEMDAELSALESRDIHLEIPL